MTSFDDAVDTSLSPRGPSMLLQIVRELDLRPDSVALDVGCGAGAHSFRLATHFGLQVLGVDPSHRHLDLAREARRDVPEEIASRVTFGRGSATDLPVADSSADLIWCRDALARVSDLDDAYAEFARALRSGGRAVIHQVVATRRLSSSEAAWLFPVMGVVPSSMSTSITDAAIAASGLVVDASLDIGSEWGEYAEEESGAAGRALLRASRLQREPDRYRSKLGDAAYEAMLGDSLWQVYLMLGKLAGRILVLTSPVGTV